MMKRTAGISLMVAAAFLPAGAALADVKAGVDAWARGDYPAAVREWQGPADKGDADAQFNLGQAYKLGRGVPADLHKAEELFGRAAGKGHLQASDMYGLLLFQRGERAKALPYVRAAADRGDPRAQYLLGVAHFNGDTVPKDWVRAYALTSLAQQAGVEQAKAALAQMDGYIPLEQRQQAAALAPQLASQAAATRARQLAAVDLGATVPNVRTSGGTSPIITSTPRPVTRSGPASTAVAAAAAAHAAADNNPRNAGADYARPRVPVAATSPTARPASPSPAAAAPRPAVATATPASHATTRTAAAAPASTSASTTTGPWRLQLGAFSVAGNANALWARVKGRPELAGHPRQSVSTGSLTKLFAGGFATREAAQAACSRLTAAGFSCLVTRT
jgi:cell division septation protein DedD